MPALTHLVMSDNQAFAGAGLATLAKQAPLLARLDLSNSKVAAVAELAPLSSTLSSLDLSDTPAAKAEGYRETAFKLLPALESLDGRDAKGEEVDESEDSESEDEARSC